MVEAVPATVEDITTDWLAARLGARVTSMRVEPVTARTGLNGEMFRLHLEGPGLPATVMAKFPADRARGVASYQRWHEREVRFYRELAEETPLRSPRCYAAEIAPNDDYVVLMEDLGHLRQGDQVAACTPAEAARAIEGAAALHARWWEAEPGPRPHAWLPFTTVGLDRAGPVQGSFARAWSLVRDGVPQPARDALDRGVEAYRDLLAEVSRGPVTVCHGDYRLDNLFFDDAAGNVIAFDWQFVCRARGTYDVAYFLALDLEPAVLAAERDALLAGYLEALRARGTEGYTEAMCRRDYAVSLVLATAVFAIGAAGEQPSEDARVTHEVGLARLGEAVGAAVEDGWL
ncbi:MAG: aminoglycoside phosphotransferase family protein [Dehalococcoidia bacterium]